MCTREDPPDLYIVLRLHLSLPLLPALPPLSLSTRNRDQVLSSYPWTRFGLP